MASGVMEEGYERWDFVNLQQQDKGKVKTAVRRQGIVHQESTACAGTRSLASYSGALCRSAKGYHVV